MLTSPQFALLRAALLDGYRTEQQLAIMVRIQLAKNLYEIAGGNTLGEVVFSLIEWAERTGHLAKLIVGAYEHNPDNDKLRHLFETQQAFIQGYSKHAKRVANDDHKAIVSILFLAANPLTTSKLRLDQEVRAIDQVLQQTKYRDRFQIEQQWAVRVTDLQAHLLRYQPDIVHFSGHSNESSELILENHTGMPQAVPPEALNQLFYTLKDNVKCVVLNACYSEVQAQTIAQSIDCVVGISGAITDEASLNFATAFYQALGYGRTVQTAFDLGLAQLQLQEPNEQLTPKLLTLHANSSSIVFV